MGTRECPYCGKMVYDRLTQCSHCRETLPEIRVASTSSPEATSKILRGLLCMFAAGVLGYLLTGSSGWKPPIHIPPVVITYLSPFLFLLGLGLGIHGLYLRHRAGS
jgi:hypothetical protein